MLWKSEPVQAAGGPDAAKRIFTAIKLKYSKKIVTAK